MKRGASFIQKFLCGAASLGVVLVLSPALAAPSAEDIEKEIAKILLQAARELSAVANASSESPILQAQRTLEKVEAEVKELQKTVDPAVYKDKYKTKYGEYEAYTDAYARIARALITLKKAQNTLDRIPNACEAAEKSQDDLIARYIREENTDGIEELPAQFEKIGQQIGLSVRQAEEMKGTLQGAFNSVNAFDPKGKEWDEVEKEVKGSAQKIFGYWAGVLKQVHTECTELAMGAKDPDVVKAVSLLRKEEGERLTAGQKLLQAAEKWQKEANDIIRLDCGAMEAIWTAYCGSDWEPNDDEDRSEAKSVADAQAAKVKGPAKEAMDDGAEIQKAVNAIDDDPETKKAAEKAQSILDKYMPRLDRLSQKGAPKGSAHPISQQAVEFGKSQHKRMESAYSCDVRDVTFPTLGSLRPDCVSFDKCTVFEFKPNSKGAIDKGGQQLSTYVPKVVQYYQNIVDGKDTIDNDHGARTYTRFTAQCVDNGKVALKGAYGLYDMCKNTYACEKAD
jgi:hypothetical protein